MALERIGVMFKSRKEGTVKMTGKLQVTVEQLRRWAESEVKEYKGKKYHEVSVGMFCNDRSTVVHYPLCEFLEGDQPNGQAEQPEGGDDDGDLPF